MKLKEYIYDKRFFIIFYFSLMIFISTIIILDPNTAISYYNVFYINLISLFIFLLYLVMSFFYKKKYYDLLNEIIDNKDNDIIYNLPEPLNYQQKKCNQLLKKVYYEQKSVIEKQFQDKKENKDFVTTWFHEIKTPIAVSRLIIEDSTDKTKAEIIKNIAEEIDKIEAQVEQALYYAKIDVFEKDYFIRQVNLNRAIKSIIKKHRRQFISKKIKINIKDCNLEVHSDKKWLSFIMDQIIGNSLKYTEKNGEMKIWINEEQKKIILHIRDNGIGIKPEDLNRVFDKGFTGYIGRREEKSTGIGLYLAKKLAKRLGHEIFIESCYGEYTEVKILFSKVSDYYKVVE